ncbi:MAG: hypothetical protein ABSG98_01785 [Anaerolineales bacterium]|jgi:hypothetical protein
MSDLVLIGAYRSIASAEQAISSLQRARFPERQVSVIVQEARASHVDGSTRVGIHPGSGIDAAIGGALGYLYGGVILRPKGLGPVLVVGPMAETLSITMGGRAAEPGSGQWLVPWASLGLTPNEIRSYEYALRDHLSLVVAQGSRDEIERARRALATVKPERLARSLALPTPGAYAD